MKIKNIVKNKIIQGFETEYSKSECNLISTVAMRKKTEDTKKFNSVEELYAHVVANSGKPDIYIIEVSFRNGTVVNFEFPKGDHVYIRQYGISVTEDGKYLFLQTWRDGLYCYETATGKLHWKSKINRVQRIYPKDDVIVCTVDFTGTVTLSVKDGMSIL